MGNLLSSKQKSVEEPSPCPSHLAPLRLVIISDTHNDHRALDLPAGDVLIHAGDFTCFGRKEHIQDFNDWLGEQPHQHKIVVNGNHENNAPWKAETRALLSHAVFLKDEGVCIPRTRVDGAPSSEEDALTVFGTDFYWPMKEGHSNPHFEAIPAGTQVLVTHGPVDGYVDGGCGCPAMLAKCESLAAGAADNALKGKQGLQLVVSGHMHSGYGTTRGNGPCRAVTFVNASSVGGGARKIANAPIVIDI